MKGEIHVIVDRAGFLGFALVFQRTRRLLNAGNVVLTLANGELRLECHNGGCVLPCECPVPLVAVLTAKAFAGLAVEHRREKSDAKTIRLTFRPEFGEFATPLAGAKAKITVGK
jgi:hypothetical protein